MLFKLLSIYKFDTKATLRKGTRKGHICILSVQYNQHDVFHPREEASQDLLNALRQFKNKKDGKRRRSLYPQCQGKQAKPFSPTGTGTKLLALHCIAACQNRLSQHRS